VIHESTYSSSERRVINKKMRKQELKTMEDTIVDTIINKKGQVVMPCFSCDRTQNILVHIKEIFDRHEELKDVQVIVDGKLTSKVMKVYQTLLEDEQLALFEDIINWKNLRIISDFQKETSLMLKDNTPKLIITSSGMCDKGRVVEYIKVLVEDEDNTVMFTGYSSPTSLATRIKEKNIYPDKKRIKIEKGMYALNFKVVELHSFSSHIQRQQIINSLKDMNVGSKIILVHGDSKGKRELAEEIQEVLRSENKTTKVVPATKDMIVEF
jgi:metallo-beta-lactamase family protein